MVEKIREQLKYVENRSKALHSYFLIELDQYAMTLSQAKSPKERAYGQNFDQLYNYEYGNRLLDKYLSRCKLKQNLAWLQYRKSVEGQDEFDLEM